MAIFSRLTTRLRAAANNPLTQRRAPANNGSATLRPRAQPPRRLEGADHWNSTSRSPSWASVCTRATASAGPVPGAGGPLSSTAPAALQHATPMAAIVRTAALTNLNSLASGCGHQIPRADSRQCAHSATQQHQDGQPPARHQHLECGYGAASRQISSVHSCTATAAATLASSMMPSMTPARTPSGRSPRAQAYQITALTA